MLQLANHFDFVRYTLAAGSAARLATISKSLEAAEDEERYHVLAITGITQAMQFLTKDNADAVLGAALGCSYTLSDPRSLMKIAKHGTEVSNQLQAWSKRSMYQRPLSLTLRPGWIVSDHEHQVTSDSDLHGSVTGVSDLLMQGVESLNKLAACFRKDPGLAAMIRRQRDALRVVHARLGNPTSAVDKYRIILPFACWFTRDATSCYIPVSKKDPHVLSFLLHMYAVVVTLTAALSARDFTIFASFRARSALLIYQALEEKETFWCTTCEHVHQSHQLTSFALSAVKLYRHVEGEGLDVFSVEVSGRW